MCNIYIYVFLTKYFLVTLAQQPLKTITNDKKKKENVKETHRKNKHHNKK